MLKVREYVCFVLLLQSGLVYAQSERCYYCNTEIHGQICNDPIDTNQVPVQRCSDHEFVTGQSYFSTIWDFFEHHNVFAEKSINATVKNTFPSVCINMTYELNSRLVSSRGCEIDQRETLFGAIDVCEFYQQLIPTARISNFTCTVCRENLCNGRSDSSTISVSLKLVVAIFVAKLFFK